MVEATPTQNRAVLQSLVSLVVTLVIMGALLFWPAGTLDWPLAWWFAAAFTVCTLIAVVVIWRVNPEIFVARSRIQPGTKWWDYFFIALIIGGQMNRRQNQTKIRNVIDWAKRVMVMFTRIRSVESRLLARSAAADRGRHHGEDHIKRDAYGDHRNCVDQCEHDEQLHAQHREQLGLARDSLEELAAKYTHTNRRANRA